MESICVSVIVPVYNCQQYLHKCLDSILQQTHHNLEIILVDDGSSDQTIDICYEYADKDDRIQVYHSENKGVSAARNYALQFVTGEYIQFVDADDAIHPNMTERLLQSLTNVERPCQWVVCNYYKIMNDCRIRNKKLDRAGVYTGVEYLINTLKDPGHHYYGVLWNKMYVTKIIKNNQLKFRVDVNLGEDFIFNLRYMMYISNVVVLPDYFYYYNRANPISLSHQSNESYLFSYSELQNRQVIYECYKKIFLENGLFEKYEKKIEHYWIVFYIRQKYQLRYQSLGWDEKEKEHWRRILSEDANIVHSLAKTSSFNIFIQYCCFACQSMIKSIIKKMMFYKK